MITPFGILGYCSNIHPGEKWEEHFAELQNLVPKVKAMVCPNQPFGIGLRIANQASIDLMESPSLIQELQHWLTKEQLFVYTINGFPYGGFHQTKVKDQVHAPDWTTRERVDYTKRLAQILIQLLPKEIETAGISTSPLSYKFWWNESNLETAFQQSTAHIQEIAHYFAEIKKETGKSIHLDIEPEPDGLLGNHQEFVDWYQHQLLENSSEGLVKEHIQICFDVCHYGVSFDEIETSLNQLKSLGIQVGKIQISSALKVKLGETAAKQLETLKLYKEPVYLHQVRAKKKDKIEAFGDLDEALEQLDSSFSEARVHFHVPIFSSTYGNIESTQEEIVKSLNYQKLHGISKQLEIETYTWGVLPQEYQRPIEESIAREVNWVLKQLD